MNQETQYEFTERLLKEAGSIISVNDYLRAIRLAIEWERKNPKSNDV